MTLSETIPSLSEIHFFFVSNEDIGLSRLLKQGSPASYILSDGALRATHSVLELQKELNIFQW